MRSLGARVRARARRPAAAHPHAVALSCRFRVDVNPLDYINNFTTASDLQDFVVSPGRTQHSIAVSNGALAITYSGQSWQEASLSGRGFSPYAFRRVPDGAHVELTSIDCSARPAGATTALCGIVVYNAGSNTPLFTWMVGYSVTFGGCVGQWHEGEGQRNGAAITRRRTGEHATTTRTTVTSAIRACFLLSHHLACVQQRGGLSRVRDDDGVPHR